MARPHKCRRIGCDPRTGYFKPRGVPVRRLQEVILTLDEFEAVRLADLEGMYQQEAASTMNVSRQTFGNIITSAHRKIADALINAKALKIAGGTYVKVETRRFLCNCCHHAWEVAHGTACPTACPHCNNAEIHQYRCAEGHVKTKVAKLSKVKCRRY